MEELKSGLYIIRNGITKEIGYDSSEEFGSILYTGKDFSMINLKNFNDCILWISNTPIDCKIEMYEIKQEFEHHTLFNEDTGEYETY